MVCATSLPTHTLPHTQLSAKSHQVPFATNTFPLSELDCHPYIFCLFIFQFNRDWRCYYSTLEFNSCIMTTSTKHCPHLSLWFTHQVWSNFKLLLRVRKKKALKLWGDNVVMNTHSNDGFHSSVTGSSSIIVCHSEENNPTYCLTISHTWSVCVCVGVCSARRKQ